MSKLERCAACGGFVTEGACPSCGSGSRLASRALAGLTGGAIAFTLMACYGAPPNMPVQRPVEPSPAVNPDAGASPLEVVPPPANAPKAP